MCILEIWFYLLVVNTMEKKIQLHVFCPQVIFLTTHLILNVVFVLFSFFFPKNIPTPYETNRMEHGVNPNFSDSKLPVYIAIYSSRAANNVFSASLHYNQCTSLFSLTLKLVQGILMFIHAIHYINFYIEVSKKHPPKQSLMGLFKTLLPQRHFLLLYSKVHNWFVPHSVQMWYSCFHITNTENS